MCDFIPNMKLSLFLKIGLLASAAIGLVTVAAEISAAVEIIAVKPPQKDAATSELVQNVPHASGTNSSQEFVLREITVSSIVVDNNRIIPADTLKEITSPYLNRRISYVDLEMLRNRLTQWLIDNGYINSGAIIPDQEVKGGIVRLAIVEGKLTSVKIEGNQQFTRDYFIDRIMRKTGPPFRISNLQEAFQLLYQDQRITAINADLAAGLTPGESNLSIRVTEAPHWQLALNVTNDNAPSIGSYRGGIQLAHRNLNGIGDTLEGNIGGSEGSFDYGLRYSLPVSAADTTLDFYFRRSSSKVIDPLFKPLDISSTSGTYGGKISHPLIRTTFREVRPFLIGEYRESRNYLLDEGFSFTDYENNGRSSFSVLRPGLEWIERRDGSVFVASTLVSTGVTDESFFSWQGRLLWMQQTGIFSSRIHFRGEAQLTDQQGLPPIEKYALGGMNSVRGYRKNLLIKNNGMNGSLEWWFPLLHGSTPGSELLSIAPFIDYGRGWDRGNFMEAGKGYGTDIASYGLGMRWAGKGLSVDFFYGYGFVKSGISKGNDPQDQGFHFAVNWNVL